MGSAASTTWNSVRRTVASRCQPAPDDCERICQVEPVYSNLCGGDNGIGRVDTGAFSIPD